MTSDDRGYGPDDLGDDEQESDVAGWEKYIEDPPDDELEVDEDADDDAQAAYDWAERHPQATGHDGDQDAEGDEEPAEHSAIHESRNP